MSNKTIPKEVKAQVEKIVQTFNTEVIKNPDYCPSPIATPKLTSG